MSLRRKISQETQEQVRQRAKGLCEYCHTTETWQYILFTIDHVNPVSRGGSNALDNLALACFHCNRRKADRMTGVDPLTGQVTPLFNPRTDKWREHFVWSADGQTLIGTTPVGRVTVELLEMNRTRILPIRLADIEIERHPPEGDPVQIVGK